MPLEGNFLKLTENEKNELIINYPNSSKFIRSLIGGEELLKSISRFCLWIEDRDLKEANTIKPIAERIKKVSAFRINGGDVARSLIEKCHQFRYRRTANNSFILIPCFN
jgi:hypothetical protein